MSDDNFIDLLANDLAPRNADEFFMGMYLAYLVDVMDGGSIPSDEELQNMLDGANKALLYWRDKYHEDILTAGGKNDQNDNGDRQ